MLWAALLNAAPLSAQAPLSAIDWLNTPAPVMVAVPNNTAPQATQDQPTEDEAPVSESAAVPSVEVMPLDADSQAASVGLLPSQVTGLPETLWKSSQGAGVTALFAALDAHRVPAMQELFYLLLLAEAEPPQGMDAEAFLTFRAKRLADFGAIEPAAELVVQLPLASARHFDLWFDLALFAGLEDKACEALNTRRALTEDYAAKIFCAMRGGAWDEASLLFETAGALNLISASERRLLQAFLDPEYAEISPNLAPPRNLSPLEFRLFEAIGSPLPTAGLPVAFAVSDLREIVGWKSQLEAAERLSRFSSVSSNELLGLYTSRKPSASGGVWERARAIQKLDRALTGEGGDVLGSALLNARAALGEVWLEATFADIYAPELKGAQLTGEAARAAFEITLLSKSYESATIAEPLATPRSSFLSSLAQGAPKGAEVLNLTLASAIEDGFNASEDMIPQKLRALMSEGELGAAILTAMSAFVRAQEGDIAALKGAIAALRFMGLEDITRRASLQLLLLKQKA